MDVAVAGSAAAPPPSSSLWIEAWTPEYGSSWELDGPAADSVEDVAPWVETSSWAPRRPRLRPLPPLAFVDGVTRVDARAILEVAVGGGTASVPGLCGSVGIGSVRVDGRPTFGPSVVKRAIVFGGGARAALPPLTGGLAYESRSVPGTAPEEIRRGLERCRAEAEEDVARGLAREGWLVVADGALGVLEPLPLVGFIKSHHRAYLGHDLEPVLRALAPGERTPLFAFGAVRPRYSWYLRLPMPPGPPGASHPWAGVARCEVAASLSLERAAELADLLTYHLPRFASRPFWDPRAPQNLVPIAGLERRLRHLLGDRELVLRRIRSGLAAAHRGGSVPVGGAG